MVTGEQLCGKVACWQNNSNMQKLTSPAFSGSAGKLGPCLSSDVRGLKKMHSPSALSFPLAVLCDDAALTLDFEHSQGPLLGILKLETSDSG